MHPNNQMNTLARIVFISFALCLATITYASENEQLEESANQDNHALMLSLLSCGQTSDELSNQQNLLLRNYIENNFTKEQEESFLRPKTQMNFLGQKVLTLFPVSLGLLPVFAIQVDANVKATLASLPDESVNKAQCIDKGCQNKLSKSKTFILSNASIWFGPSATNDKTTVYGCMYPYKR